MNTLEQVKELAASGDTRLHKEQLDMQFAESRECAKAGGVQTFCLYYLSEDGSTVNAFFNTETGEQVANPAVLKNDMPQDNTAKR